MPRAYVRVGGKRSYANYNEEQMTAALKAIEENGFSVNAAAETFGIKRETLRHRLKGKHSKKIGGQLSIKPEIEQQLSTYLKKCAEWGFPLDTLMIRQVVKGFLDTLGIIVPKFKVNIPGVDWVNSFLKRNDLVNKRIKNISNARAEVTKEQLDCYFENLKETISGVPPENILNYDETCMHDDPGKKKGVAGKGQKYVERKLNTTKSGITVMFAGTAAGELLPPYVVYKSENMWDTWREGGPKGSRYNRSKSGWFDGNIFEDWFFQIALPFLKKKVGTKVIIGDNLASHLSAGVLDGCLKNDIHYVFLPANASHLCQPLDVGFYGPLKTAWRRILMNFKLSHPGKVGLPKECFPTLLSKLMKEMELNTSKCLQSGFRKSGIYPFNRQEVYKSLPSTTGPSTSTATSTFTGPSTSTGPSTYTVTSTSTVASTFSVASTSTGPSTSTVTSPPISKLPLPNIEATPEIGNTRLVQSAPASICRSCTKPSGLSPTKEAISSSVLELLKKMRSSNTQNRKKRKKKVEIEPGKSVKELETESSVDDPPVPTISGVVTKPKGKENPEKRSKRTQGDKLPKKKARRRLKKEYSSDESEAVDMTSPESDSNDEDFGVQVLNEIENERREEEELQDIVEGNVKPGVWVLVEGKGKNKKPKHYIGQVVNLVKEKEDVKIKFLKKQDKFLGDRPYFTWLESDGSIVDMGYVKKILPEPNFTPRGWLIFPITFGTQLNVQ